MHKGYYVFPVFLLICISLVSGNNNYYEVTRGERPPMDYNKLEENAYNKGVLLIKFNKGYEDHLSRNPLEKDNDGFVRFHLEAIDRLNREYGVRSAKQHFSSPAFRSGFTERHKAWGFHLWYRLELDENADIISLIRYYNSLREVDIAEPELVKKLIGSHDPNDYYTIDPVVVSSDRSWTPNDPQFINQWHYHNTGQQNGTPGADISLPDAWSLQKGDPAVIVAIIDGGIDYEHVDLAGNMWPDIGYNFVANSPNVQAHNHGTHVAGTIAAVSNNNIGVAGIAGGSGINDGVRLMSCQVFTTFSSGGFHIAPIYAADNGAAISQNSWGYTSPNYYEQSTLDAIDYFNANGGGDAMNGGITIFAAGNSNSSAAYYPGYYSGALSVAATNNQDAKSWYSNYGSWIDISAPGGETNTVTERGVLSTLNDNSYGYYQGTSMACPHVSGVVALMLSSVYGEFSPEDIKDILLNTADNHYAANPGFPGQLGAGRLNAYLALAVSEEYLNMPANPVGFQASGFSDSEISLNWQLNSEANPVILAWSPDGVFGIPQEGTTYLPGNEIEGGGEVLYAGSDLSFIHSGLEAVTHYYYKIWSVDEQTNYSMGRTANAVTLCSVYSLPVFESFNSDLVPVCWSFPQGQGNWKMTGQHGNPSPSIQFEWTPTVNNYSFSLESPPLDGNISGNEITLQFDLMLDNYSTNTLEQMIVQVYDGAQWADVLTFDNSGGDISWQTYTATITEYALNRIFMVRFTAAGANSWNLNRWVIDNFAVYSTICPAPSGLHAGQVGSSSAEITWQPGGSESFWELKWGPQGFDPQSSGNLVPEINEPYYFLEGLESSSAYDVYVRSLCAEDEVSFWAGPVIFNTQCGIIELPFTETFHGGSVDCWTFPQGQGNWSFGSQYAPPSSESGTPHATFNWTPNRFSYSYSLTSPLLLASNPHGIVKTDFIVFLNNYDNNNLEQMSVEYQVFGEEDWQLLENFTNSGLGGGNAEFVSQDIVIPGVQGQMFQLRFRAHGENSFSINGWSVDDVYVYQEIPECQAPVALSVDDVGSHDALVSWIPASAESTFTVIWGESGFDPGTEGTLIENIEENELQLLNLKHSTSYDFYVKSVCSTDLESDWSGPETFTTLDYSYILQIRVILEGAFASGRDQLMSTSLKENNMLPYQHPFNPDLPYYGNNSPVWFYEGDESVENFPDGTVDWILLELRDASSAESALGNTVAARKAGFLLNDGTIVTSDGSLPEFDIHVNHNLFVVVYHRNHLAVMSSGSLKEVDGIYLWNFTQSQEKAFSSSDKTAYEGGQKYLGDGIYGMFGGDGDGDGQVLLQDLLNVLNPLSGQSGYSAGDFDLDGQVLLQDLLNILNPNSGLGTQVP